MKNNRTMINKKKITWPMKKNNVVVSNIVTLYFHFGYYVGVLVGVWLWQSRDDRKEKKVCREMAIFL